MNIITKVKKLDLPLGLYVVIGSGIMAQLGLRAANDVDIAVTPDLCATLRASGEWEEAERYGKIFLKKEVVEITPRLDWESYSTTVEAAIASATIIDGVPFMDRKRCSDHIFCAFSRGGMMGRDEQRSFQL
jgi:hypothetical protein